MSGRSDDDEVVYIRRSHATNMKDSSAYHTDPDCVYINDGHREWDRDMAEEWGYSECKICRGEYKAEQGDYSHYNALLRAAEEAANEEEV